MKKEEILAYAFWENTGFPYLLSSGIVSFEAKGFVRLSGYGMLVVKPAFILSVQDGKALAARLSVLHADHSAAFKLFHEEWMKKRAQLLAEYGGKD